MLGVCNLNIPGGGKIRIRSYGFVGYKEDKSKHNLQSFAGTRRGWINWLMKVLCGGPSMCRGWREIGLLRKSM